MSKFSVKKPFTVFVAVVFALILGLVSFMRMSTDLLPEFSLPYVVVVTTQVGASPDKIEATITEPLESGLGTVNGVVNVTSTSNENYSMVMLEFEENANMDSAMVKLASALDLIPLPEDAGQPMIMEISMDMLPVVYTSVSYDGMDIYELSDFVEDTVVPQMERQNGVASVDATGLIEETVEIRLNQEKVDDLNGQLAAYVTGELDDAKTQLDDAQAELTNAKAQLDSAASALDSQQASTAEQLAQASQGVDQAVATQAAYQANLTTLNASKTALEAEMQAYEDAAVVDNYNNINTALAGISADPTIAGMAASQGLSLPTDIDDAIANPTKWTDLATVVTTLQDMGVPGMEDLSAITAMQTTDLSQLQTAVDRIPQIETELANLDTEILAAQTAVDMVNEQIAPAVDNYTKLEVGKITAAAGFGSGAAQIASGQSAIDDGQAKLDEAMESYENGRDTALKSANLDALLSFDTLTGLIYAQNFSMPAGYIYQDEDQYLLKVGDEFASKEELENTLLCEIDGIGEVHLCDVADVTWIDNVGDIFAKVNGENGILISVSKASTAGTSDVSDAINAKFASMEEEYEGLHFTNLMDQGDYIDLIVKNVLQNLIIGAILAVIVLAIFLRSIKPTIVVAFSIPLSVLVAVVLMYFSGITLNIISLSGLALSVGMLVDNSIVVLENIYRLKAQGMSSARAAVAGAKQVAGAIVASTLTTICVYLPIVFTTGLVKQLFVDMALTITYALVASLIIALTLVPAMSSTLLRNIEPKEQKMMGKVMDVYGKALSFCLKHKYIPIIVTVALLAACGAKALKTGMVLFPEMGGEQMTVNLTAEDDMSDEEVFALADDAMAQMMDIEGVEYVGMMSGSNTGSGGGGMSMMGSSGGTHELSTFVLVDEETAKDNSGVAKELEAICEGLDLKDYSVSTSNMDFSSYMESGLSISIYGSDTDELLAVSEDVMDIVAGVEGFENVSNGQEQGDETIELTIQKDEAMKYGLTVAQILQELSGNLTTEKPATILTIDGEQYDVILINENDAVQVDELMDYEFDYDTTDEDGNAITETHELREFATMTHGQGLQSIRRDNQKNYITVTAETMDGYNTTLQSRVAEEELANYQAPDGVTIEIGGEMNEINDALKDMVLMLILGIIFIYLIMIAQFQSLASPFIVLFTIPLAFTGGFLGIFISGRDISLVGLMGFLMLAGVVVNNGIVFVDYANQMRLNGMEKHEALLLTGKNRMRPILMTMLTTVLAMIPMVFSTDAAAEMSKDMAVVVIGGLLYATLTTLFIVPVLYDLFFRRDLKKVDLGDEEDLDHIGQII